MPSLYDAYPTIEDSEFKPLVPEEISKQIAELIAQTHQQTIFDILNRGPLESPIPFSFPEEEGQTKTTFEKFGRVYKLDMEAIEKEFPSLTKMILPSNTLTNGSLLNSLEQFTGISEDVSNFHHLVLCVFSDVASLEEGCTVEWSVDGVSYITTQSYTIVPGNILKVEMPIMGTYVRIVYRNGPKPQGTFYLKLEGMSLIPSIGSLSSPSIQRELDVPMRELGGQRKYNLED